MYSDLLKEIPLNEPKILRPALKQIKCLDVFIQNLLEDVENNQIGSVKVNT